MNDELEREIGTALELPSDRVQFFYGFAALKALIRKRDGRAEFVELLEKANEYLKDTQDAGPIGEGWKSEELVDLIAEINDVVARAREGK